MVRFSNRPATAFRWRRRRPMSTRPACEILEGRQLLSGSSTVWPAASSAPPLSAIETMPGQWPSIPIHPVTAALLSSPGPELHPPNPCVAVTGARLFPPTPI
jgi:hypothetical protein